MGTSKAVNFSEALDAVRSAAEGNALPALVITHERPDGDAVGSSVGMMRLLNENGFDAKLFLPDEVPDFYKAFLPEKKFLVSPENADEVNKNYSIVINTDASTVPRLGLGNVKFEGISIPFLTFDHHVDDTFFGTWSCVIADASSASEIVYDFAKASAWKISPDAATNLLLGITTDTGCFRFTNTKSATLRAAADLLERGADHGKIIDKAYLSKPFNMAVFEAELMCRNLKTAFDGAYAWFTVTREILDKYSIDIRNTEQLIENVRGIDGVKVAALIKPTSEKGIFKISLRSKDKNISVGQIARRLNGGGHEMAAGGTIFAKTLEDAEEVLLRQVETEMLKK